MGVQGKVSLEKLVDGVRVLQVVCNQWGDSGKGKFSDYFAANWADITARGTGGNNAGHTVVVNDKQFVFHLLPSGITQDGFGKQTILGSGMVIDLDVLWDEMSSLRQEGYTHNNLRISRDAHIILPWHKTEDQRNVSQANGGIGTTGRGIGPCYTDKVARKGVRIRDIKDPDTLAEALRRSAGFHGTMDDVDKAHSKLTAHNEWLSQYEADTGDILRRAVRQGKRVVLEGAQGLLLSVEFGTYGYVTSSDPSALGTAAGVGLGIHDIDKVLGIVKFPFMTRVGAGPFPTELGSSKSEKHCADGNHLVAELEYAGIPYKKKGKSATYDATHPRIRELIGSDDDFEKGMGIRLAAGEYGATTGRPRRTGWTDAVAARYAVEINGPDMILTKPDCLVDVDRFAIAYGHCRDGQVHETFSMGTDELCKSTPALKWYDGYGDIRGVRDEQDLPASFMQAVSDFECFTGGRALVISTGPDRNDTIVRK